MTPAWIEKLIEGSAALGVALDGPTAEALAKFADRLLEWGAKMDLTSITDPGEIREKHFLDSLAAVPLLGEAKEIVDLGSGAGFPGLVLAAILRNAKVLSVESRSKKSVFQRQVIRELGLANATAETARAEEVIAKHAPPTFVTARALTDLDDLIRLTEPWLAKGTTLLAFKASGVDEELAKAKARIERLGLAIERRDWKLPESGDPRTFVLASGRRST